MSVGDEQGSGKGRLPTWGELGPGLITGAADDDPSSVGTYSLAGAQFGYLLLWLIPFCIPLMIAIQEMCGRVAIVTGEGLAAIVKKHYPRWVLYPVVLLLFGANVVSIYADLNAIAASAQMLFGLSHWIWLTVFTLLITALIILVPYRTYSQMLKWLVLILLSYVVVVFIPGVRVDWKTVGVGLVTPAWRHTTPFLLLVVGILGTTISPYLFFWQAGEEVEEEIEANLADRPGHRIQKVRPSEIRTLRRDTAVGMIGSQIVCAFILICAAGTLHVQGKFDIDTAEDAAKALLPLGKAGYAIFTLGIVSSGLVSIPTLAGSTAYALAETTGWRYGLYRRFSRARAFYVTIAVTVVLGYALNFVYGLSPMKGLLYSAAANGIVSPPIIFLLLLICNNKEIMRHRTNGFWSNLFGGLSAVLMAVASIYFLWLLCSGKR